MRSLSFLALLAILSISDALLTPHSARWYATSVDDVVSENEYHSQRSGFGASKSSRLLSESGRPDVRNCTLQWFDQRIDHFSSVTPPGGQTTFKQRYFVCNSYWGGSDKDPLFFYVGNEADVTLYVNETGLMWETAPRFSASMLFAEHRFYGLSQPFGNESQNHMEYLSTEQALADYSSLLWWYKDSVLQNRGVATIGFGGSYGGMLAAWMRYKYPHALDGAIAASAPIWSFLGEDPPYDQGSYAKLVTADASSPGGAPEECSKNIRSAWDELFRLGRTSDGRRTIKESMSLCNIPTSFDDVIAVAYWAQSAFDYLSMGDFPYPSSYILNGGGVLPAYPMREACKHMTKPANLLTGLKASIGVFYNYSASVPCFNLTGPNKETSNDGLFWDYQFCTEMFQPMSRNGEDDMFWEQPFNATLASDQCFQRWGVRPRMNWATINYGGKEIGAASNILFSNGLLDPWSGGGVLQVPKEWDSIKVVTIEGGAHHIDLMFSNPLDPPSVTQARDVERETIAAWIAEKDSRLSDFVHS